MTESTPIRRAGLADASSLTELTMRSKARWRYDALSLANARPELLRKEGEILGYCRLIPVGNDTMKLHDVFVAPQIGQGYGNSCGTMDERRP